MRHQKHWEKSTTKENDKNFRKGCYKRSVIDYNIPCSLAVRSLFALLTITRYAMHTKCISYILALKQCLTDAYKLDIHEQKLLVFFRCASFYIVLIKEHRKIKKVLAKSKSVC